MILKLTFPYINKQITEGLIVKWHKSEGEWVDHGDDLFDLEVRQVKKIKREKNPQKILKNMLKLNTIARETFVQNNRSGQQLKAIVRVSSSDIGFLRFLYIKEPGEQKVGTVLAILTTEENEQINLSESELNQAASFRVATNFILD